MIKTITETVLNQKVGIITASSPVVVKIMETLNWLDANIAQLGLWASLILTLILAVSHFCKTIWHNRIQSVEIRNKEVELEKKEIEVKLLKLELMERLEEHSEDNNNK
jgi:hypothetical protein